MEVLTPEKLLARLPRLLAHKAGNNLYKLENEIRQIVHFLYQNNTLLTNTLLIHYKITKKVYNSVMKS